MRRVQHPPCLTLSLIFELRGGCWTLPNRFSRLSITSIYILINYISIYGKNPPPARPAWQLPVDIRVWVQAGTGVGSPWVSQGLPMHLPRA